MVFSELQSQLVVSNHIFQFLSWNDLLRLRRVCKEAKNLAEDYLRLHRTLKEFVYICEDNISEFLLMSPSLPISRFDLYVSPIPFFKSEHSQTLVGLYGDKITHLNLRFLEIPMDHCPEVVTFFDSLPNLSYMETNLRLLHPNYEGRDSHGKVDSSTEPTLNICSDQELTLPSAFKRLRHLKIREFDCDPDLTQLQFLWTFLEECSAHLETLLIPNLPSADRFAAITDGEFRCIKGIIEMRHQERPNHPNLSEIDLDEIIQDLDYINASSFYELVSSCSKHNVKLTNVCDYLVEGMMRLDSPDKAEHGQKISSVVTSLRNLYSNSFLLELPHLTQICINDGETGTDILCSMPIGGIGNRQDWPNLKILDILVDSESIADDDGGQVPTSELLHFLFKGIRRENMETLHLSFKHDEYANCDPPIPKMKDMYSSCPNLKVLEIDNWLGTNKAIYSLWGNLPLLEKLTFSRCENLRNSAFTGKDKANPAIMKMKSLKSLTLNGLEEMPKISDTLFKTVLRHVPLRELRLKSSTGSTPLTSITMAGILSLLIGEFARSIEKLEFGISLQDATDEELADLANLFRSAKML